MAKEHAGAGTAQQCPACAGSRRDGRRRVSDHEYNLSCSVSYARCGDCGSEYQDPMPDLQTLASFYPNGYHSFAGHGLLQRLRNDLRLRRLSRFLDGPGALLDYGCGNGAFLEQAAEKLPNRSLFGFEIAPRYQRQALADGRITIIRGHSSDLIRELPPCRLITMNHVIEHLREPVEVIRALAERLSPGGTFEGQTPAAESTEQRVFGGYWSGYHAPRHTVVFSRRGLKALLERASLRQLEFSAAFNPAGLAISIASVSHGDSPGRVHRRGLRWMVCLGLATVLAPIDLLTSPAVLDFAARRAA